jgi:uncharacterized protein (TIGR01440 family)
MSSCDDPRDNGTTLPSSADLPNLKTIQAELIRCLTDLQGAAQLTSGDLLVIGASSSEVTGQPIGTHTSLDVGRALVDAVLAFQQATGCEVAFQCCEHLNRALVVSSDLARQRGWQVVNAIPVPGAGGALAAQAYVTLPKAVLVEAVTADAGVDIGDTLIGMHLRRVAVPVRSRQRKVGAAHVTLARTRPPLIGGARAVYDPAEASARLGR